MFPCMNLLMPANVHGWRNHRFGQAPLVPMHMNLCDPAGLGWEKLVIHRTGRAPGNLRRRQ